MIICITKKYVSKLSYNSPITRQDFSYYLPLNKLVNDKVYFEKRNIKNRFRIIYNLDGFDDDGINKERFDRDGFNRKGVDEYGYNSNKELACKKNLNKQKEKFLILINTPLYVWNIMLISLYNFLNKLVHYL